MKLKVIGSSSAGNCYVLQPEIGKSLILEAGCKLDELGKMIHFSWGNIAGCLVTHEHQDHASHITDLQKRGVKIYATAGTATKLNNPNILKLEEVSSQKKCFNVGDFKCKWFNVTHDAAHPVGYLISHKEMGILAFITDTAEIKNKFPGVNHLMVEANYDPDHPRFNTLSESYINRVMLSHLSIEQTAEFVRQNTADLQTITLIHLSSRHADRKEFTKKIKEVCLRAGTAPKIEVATPWLVRDLPNYNKPNF